MNSSYGVRGQVGPTADRPQARTAPLVVIGVFLGAVVLVGLLAFIQGI